MRNSQRCAFTLMEVLVVLSIIALLVALSLAAIQRVRATAAAAQCLNNLKQLGLALQNYHDTQGAFPPGCRGTGSAQPFMSWMTRLLPHMEQEALWQEALRAFTSASFFENPPHHPMLSRPMVAFLCPLEPRTHIDFPKFSVAFTTYLGVSGRSESVFDGVLFLDSAIRIADVTDGTSQTIVVGERPPSRDGRFGWWYAGWGLRQAGTADLFLGVRERGTEYRHCSREPEHFRPGSDDDCDTFHFWSRHSGGAHFVYCDASVRFLAYSADPIMPALATRAGGEAVSVPD